MTANPAYLCMCKYAANRDCYQATTKTLQKSRLELNKKLSKNKRKRGLIHPYPHARLAAKTGA